MTASAGNRDSAILLGVGSDIGASTAQRLASDGWHVTGTYRTAASAERLADIPGMHLVRCDISSRQDVEELAETARRRQQSWTLFLSAVGRLDPIGRWQDLDYDRWQESVLDNSLHQLRALHAVLPMRRQGGAHAAFCARGGTH